MITTLFMLSLQGVLFVLLSPGVVGLTRWYKARLQARRGASILQPYWDLWKLLRKPSNLPRIASWFFSVTPGVIFSCYVVLGMFLPTVYAPDALALPGIAPSWLSLDLVTMIYLVGIARFLEALATFDVATQFGPLSAGRQLFVHILVQPVLLVVTYALVLRRGTSDIVGILADNVSDQRMMPALILVLLALGLIVLAESGRLPFDSPDGHLELSMMEQGTHLEYSGRVLALMEWAGAMKFTFFLSLLAGLAQPFFRIVLPVGSGQIARWGVFLTELAVLAFLLALWEMWHTKLRIQSISYPLVMALAFALVAVMFMVTAG